MSAGLMCLRCRKYIGTDDQPNVSEPCTCEDPIPSWDGKVPVSGGRRKTDYLDA